jgi:hypothetical protein
VIVEGEIKLAESDVTRAQGRLEWAKRMMDKGYVSPAQKGAEALSLQKAVLAKEQAESKLKVLMDYTKAKTIKELHSEVEKARVDERAKQADWDLERRKVTELERLLNSGAD